jgi:hypothetical protein
MSEPAILFGGPFNGLRVNLRRHPRRIEVRGRIYELIVDPDTGEGLGAYTLTADGRSES